MNAKVEKAGGAATPSTSLMSTLAVLLLMAGVFAYYWFTDWSGVARFGVLMAGIAGVRRRRRLHARRDARCANFSSNRSSSCARSYGRRATKRCSTTLVIIVVVIILSLLLGLIDVILKWVVLDHLLKLGR